jgi:hypothetical protein
MIALYEVTGFFFLLIFLVPYILFILTQQETLKAIQPGNRSMPPGEVWLQLIPFFNLIWHFIVVRNISKSIRNEFKYREQNSFLGLADPEITAELHRKPTLDIGIAYCVLAVLSLLIGSIVSLAALICWIIYWVKLNEYKNKLKRLSITG